MPIGGTRRTDGGDCGGSLLLRFNPPTVTHRQANNTPDGQMAHTDRWQTNPPDGQMADNNTADGQIADTDRLRQRINERKGTTRTRRRASAVPDI